MDWWRGEAGCWILDAGYWMNLRATRVQSGFRCGKQGHSVEPRLEALGGGRRLWKRDGVGEWFGIDCLSYG